MLNCGLKNFAMAHH